MAHLTPPAARRNTAALIFFWASALFLIFALAAGGLVSCSSPAVDDLNLAYLDGTSGRLSDYRGQVVLLNFWATWCAPCREEMPELQAYYDDHRDQGFVLLAVCIQIEDIIILFFIVEGKKPVQFTLGS